MRPQSFLQLLQQYRFVLAQLHVLRQLYMIGLEYDRLYSRLEGDIAQFLLQGALTVERISAIRFEGM